MKNLARRWMAGLLALSLLLGMPALAVEAPSDAASAEEVQVSPLADTGMGDTSKDIPVEGITATAGNSQPSDTPELVLDGNGGTHWHTLWAGSDRSTHWITLDLGKEYPVDGLRYLPRQDDQLNGTITKYEIWASTDGEAFSEIASGDWAADHEWKTVSFTPYYIRYIKLVALNACDEGNAKFASAAEIRVTQAEVEKQDTEGMLDLIYVDVYHKTRWPMYTLVSKINSMNMAMATEYPSAVDQHSVWAHHVGGNITQDSLTGNLIRFVNNQYQDIFGKSSLFRGTDRVSGINGWQNASDYNGSLEHFYTSVLPNRFLVQYPIMQWESTDKVVLGEKLNVVTKMENGTNVITLDGNEVARGNKIFIPFTVDGVEKIYHWNDQTGDTTWTLPSTFAGQTSVKVFQLSDKGRTNMQTVKVEEGKVTIHADAKTPYVIYKGDANVDVTGSLTSYDWGQGGLVKDPGFDSFTPGYGWTVENAQFWDNDHENTYLVMNGAENGSATQTISGLTPGKTYQASVWAEVSGKTASITVSDGDTQLATNYMTESNVMYGIHHTDKYQRYLQRMWVEFTAPESGTVTLSLTGTNGTGTGSYVHFDDVRIVEHTPSDPGSHTFYEDFENTTEGYGIFVSTESDMSHLSETNAPHTFDTIAGKFSLKTRAGDYFRTLPHTLRLKANTEYTIGLEYIAGSAGQVFTLAVKSDKAAAAKDTDNAVVATTVCSAVGNWGKNAPVTLTFTTGNYDDYYVDITKSGSISEYAIDNFFVDEISEASKDTLRALYEQCEALTEADYTPETWAVLTEKMATAKTVLEKSDASQEEIQQAQDALQTAKDALVAYAKAEDLDRLRAVIAEMEAVKPDYYHQDEQWTAFQKKITEAKALKDAEKVTVPQVDAMIQALRDAKAALNSLVDKSKLRELYDFCAAIPQNDVVDGNELVTFLRVRSDADTVLKKESAQQTEVDDALKALSDAYDKIVPKRTTNEGHTDAAIVKELAAKLAAAEAVESPSAELTAAIELAKAASADMATWKSVVEAIAALDAAMTPSGDSFVVTFDSQGGSDVAAQTVKKGEKATEPTAPAKDGYTFTGWYTEPACENRYDFNAPVTAAITLYAGWSYNSTVTQPTLPTPGKPVTEGDTTTVTTQLRPSVSGGTASVNVSGTTMNKAVDSALTAAQKSGTAPVVEFKVNTQASTVKVTLPAAGLKTLSGTENASLRIVAGVGTVTLDAAALAAAAGNDNVTITISRLSEKDLTDVQKDAANGMPVYDITLTSGSSVITDLGGGLATITLPYTAKEDQKSECIVVYYMAEDGTLTPCETTYNAADKTVTFVTGHFSKYVIGYDPALAWVNPFADVAESAWYYDAVRYVCSNGLMTGTSDSAFSPDLFTTRGMIVTILYRLEGSPAVSGTASFRDVPAGQYYSEAVAWAAANGIVKGYDTGLFGPDDVITREQLAVILYGYAQYKGYDVTTGGDLSGFADNASVSAWAADALKWANGQGLITGKSGNLLDPAGTATRAEAASILSRFCKSI